MYCSLIAAAALAFSCQLLLRGATTPTFSSASPNARTISAEIGFSPRRRCAAVHVAWMALPELANRRWWLDDLAIKCMQLIIVAAFIFSTRLAVCLYVCMCGMMLLLLPLLLLLLSRASFYFILVTYFFLQHKIPTKNNNNNFSRSAESTTQIFVYNCVVFVVATFVAC